MPGGQGTKHRTGFGQGPGQGLDQAIHLANAAVGENQAQGRFAGKIGPSRPQGRFDPPGKIGVRPDAPPNHAGRAGNPPPAEGHEQDGVVTDAGRRQLPGRGGAGQGNSGKRRLDTAQDDPVVEGHTGKQQQPGRQLAAESPTTGLHRASNGALGVQTLGMEVPPYRLRTTVGYDNTTTPRAKPPARFPRSPPLRSGEEQKAFCIFLPSS